MIMGHVQKMNPNTEKIRKLRYQFFQQILSPTLLL